MVSYTLDVNKRQFPKGGNMKKFSKNLCALVVGSVSMAASAGIPVIVDAPVDHLFIPAGFDNNDATEVVVSGYFPNLCYRKNMAEVKLKGDTIHIKVSALYNIGDDASRCADMLVPFKEVVNVGNLQAGDYKIKVNAETEYEQSESLKIAEASTNAVDEHIYAYVDTIEKTPLKNKVILKGYTPSDCLVFDRIETHSNNKDSIAILPIMKKTTDFCPMKMVPFKKDVEFSLDSLKYDKALIHVRVMDGRSVNTIIDLKEEK